MCAAGICVDVAEGCCCRVACANRAEGSSAAAGPAHARVPVGCVQIMPEGLVSEWRVCANLLWESGVSSVYAVWDRFSYMWLVWTA